MFERDSIDLDELRVFAPEVAEYLITSKHVNTVRINSKIKSRGDRKVLATLARPLLLKKRKEVQESAKS